MIIKIAGHKDDVDKTTVIYTFDANQQAVILQFESDEERLLVADFIKCITTAANLKVAFCPDSMSDEDADQFMKDK